jgi:hypothetical protein
MRLAALCKSHGFDLSAVAALCGVDPSLLVNIDAGIQALPRALAVQIASVLTESVANVQASALLNTNLNTSSLYTARPPPYGTPITPARITPTVVLQPPAPPVPLVGPNFWIGFNTPGEISPPADHPVVKLANLNAAGDRLTLVGTALTTGQLHDPSQFAAFNGDLPLNRNYIIRASQDEVWVLLYGPAITAAPFTPYIARFNNRGTLIDDFFPMQSDPADAAWVMAKDPASANVWCSGDQGRTFRASVGTPSVQAVITPPSPGTDVYITDMLFVAGRLYCAFGLQRGSDGIGIMEFDPVLDVWVQTTPGVPSNPAPASYPVSFCFVDSLDSFAMTAPGSLNAVAIYRLFDRATLTLGTFSFSLAVPYDAIQVIDVTYSTSTNKLWFIAEVVVGDSIIYRLVEVGPGDAVASRSITVKFTLTNGSQQDAVIRSFFQRDGKLYIQSFSEDGSESGVCIVSMASGETLSTLPSVAVGFDPWNDYIAPFSYVGPLEPRGG